MDEPAPFDFSRRPKIATRARLRHDKASNRLLLVFPEGALELNPTAAAVLELCDGLRSVAEIAALLADRFPGTARQEIEQDVVGLVSGLVERRLLEV